MYVAQFASLIAVFCLSMKFFMDEVTTLRNRVKFERHVRLCAAIEAGLQNMMLAGSELSSRNATLSPLVEMQAAQLHERLAHLMNVHFCDEKKSSFRVLSQNPAEIVNRVYQINFRNHGPT